MPKYGGANLPPGMVPGGGRYGSGSGIAGQMAGNYGNYGVGVNTVPKPGDLREQRAARENVYRDQRQRWLAQMEEDRKNQAGIYSQEALNKAHETGQRPKWEDYHPEFLSGALKDQQYNPWETNPALTGRQIGNQVYDSSGRLLQSTNQSGGPSVTYNQNQQQGGYWGNDPNNPNQKKWYGQGQPTTGPSGRPMMTSVNGQFVPVQNQATDPYQLPMSGKPQFSTQPPMMSPGQPQISTVGPSMVGPNAGPRPRPRQGPNNQATDPYQIPMAPGQQQYNGPKIAPMQNTMTPIGAGGPTRYVGPYGANFAPQGTTQGQPRQFLQTKW